MTRVLIFGAVFAGVGAVLAFIASRLWRWHRNEVDGLVARTGRVIRVIESDVDGQHMYQPVVQFVVKRTSYVCTDSAFHGKPEKIGASHVVFYARGNPNDARLSQETGSLFGARLVGMFGITFFVVGAIALVAYLVGPETSFGAFVRDALS